MSEYVFPRSYSYTEGSGSGSGSGSGETFGPCEYCGFPPGTSIDTHFIDTGILVSSLAIGSDRCCPVYARPTTKPCVDCGFPPGTNSDTHYIDISVVVDIDATGQAECCPAISRNSTKPCTYCGFPEGTSSDTHYIAITGVVPVDADGIYACCQAIERTPETLFPCISCGSEPGFIVDTTATFDKPSQCCPTELINNTECDPPCSGCTTCDTEGNCVELERVPCEIDGLIWPSGTTPLTHIIDTTETKCPLDLYKHCQVVPRDENDPEKQTTVIDVPAKQIVASMPFPNIYKKGKGTLIIKPPANPSAPNRPICKSIVVADGTVILADKGASNSSTTLACLSPESKIDLSVGPETVICRNVQFGSIPLSSSSSYTSSSRVYSGTINIGFGGLLIDSVPSINEIRSLLIAGRNDGSWNGSYGFVTNKEVNGIKNIGYNITENGGVLIKWAASGDTNLDGFVDILDVSNILASNKYDSGATNATWIDGDFNYDGMLDILDVSLFLAQGSYDTGNYLPQNTEFQVSWSPDSKSIPENSPIVVSTNDITKIDPVRVYPTTTVTEEWNKACSIMTREQCNRMSGSFFNSGTLMCHDDACSSLVPQFPNAGACCKPDNSCVVLTDTTIKTAPEHCQDLQGTWAGYNTTCTDQICSSSTQQISDS